MKLLLLAVVTAIAAAGDLPEPLEEFRTGNRQFSADVYKEFKKTSSRNFLICPLSVQVVLALLESGSGGSTAQQLSTGLRIPATPEKLHETFKQLSSGLRGSKDAQIKSANKIYVKKGFAIKNDYKTTAVDVFGAEIQNIDFKNTVQAAHEINQWVEGKTDKKIKNLVDPKSLSENSVAVLVNALYFHGEWVKKFPHEATRFGQFHLNSKKHINVQMMSLEGGMFDYHESSELKAKFLEISYEGFDVSMTIALPDDVEGLSGLEDNIADILVTPRTCTSTNLIVTIPKFKIETSINFNSILETLGIKDAFSPSANFSGIGAGTEHLQVSQVLQKAFIEVQEDGTTAAAATLVDVGRSMGPSHETPKIFKADHPFIFFLKSQSAGVLFVGRYVGVQ